MDKIENVAPGKIETDGIERPLSEMELDVVAGGGGPGTMASPNMFRPGPCYQSAIYGWNFEVATG